MEDPPASFLDFTGHAADLTEQDNVYLTRLELQ
jgi:hypothetical protein